MALVHTDQMAHNARELTRIADQLRRSVYGDAWHGPAVKEVLEGVNARQASATVLPDCHSAWEILVHMTAWTRATRRALGGAPLRLTDQEDWPPPAAISEAEWDKDQAEFLEETEDLLSALQGREDPLLDEIVPGHNYNYYFLLHGLVQHNLYHTGQIRLLTK